MTNLSNNVKDNLIIIAKGILIGFVSVAIPGLSAGTFAILLGVYYLMIDSLSNILKNFKKSMSFLIFLMIGFAIGAFVGALSINALYEQYPLIVVFVIFGFITGSMIPMMKKLVVHAKNAINWIIFALVIIVILSYTIFITQGELVSLDKNMAIGDYIKLAIVGLITSITTIVPGFDFAIICLSLGYYYSIMGTLANIVQFHEIIHSLIVILTYLAGNVTGMILLSKLVKKLYVKCPVQVEFASAGFVAAAPFVVFRNCITDNPNFAFTNGQFVFGAFMSLIAYGIIALIHHMSETKNYDPRPFGRKKRNMFRFFFNIGAHLPLAAIYSCKLKKIANDEHMPFEEKYKDSVTILKNIEKYGKIYPKVFGKENLVRDKGVLIVSNHQGRYDGIGIFTSLDDYPCSVIVDKGMVKVPMYKYFTKTIDAKLIDKKDPKQALKEVDRMASDIKNGRSNILFPEGDWGDNKNSLQKFFTGGLSAAYKSKCDITPIVLYDTYKVYGVSSLKKVYPEIHILPKICYDEYKDLTKPELAELLKSIMQEKLNELTASHPEEKISVQQQKLPIDNH